MNALAMFELDTDMSFMEYREVCTRARIHVRREGAVSWTPTLRQLLPSRQHATPTSARRHGIARREIASPT
jgi:hypothetical protein